MTTTTDSPTTVVPNPVANFVKIKPIIAGMAKIVPATTFAKIAPKPISPIVKQTSNNSKLVLIQSPGGTAQTIRISGTANTPTSSSGEAGSSGGGIRIIKMADGQLYQVKNKPLVATAISSTDKKSPQTPQTHIGRFIVKGGAGQRIVLTTPPSTAVKTVVSSIGATSGATTTRTYTVAQAQQLGLLSAARIKELVSQATTVVAKKPLTPILPASSSAAATTSPATVIAVSSCSTATVASAVKPTASVTHVGVATTSTAAGPPKIILKTVGGVQKQVTLPQNIVKLAQGGQIRAVNVAGRGIQYVRVFSGTTASQTATTTATIVAQATDRNKLIATASGASKVLVQSSGSKQTYTLLSSSSANEDTKLIKTITGISLKPNVGFVPHTL